MNKLNILWTTTNRDTVINMIAMYSMGSISHGWWEHVNVIVWGASTKLLAEDTEIQGLIQKMMTAGITVEACLSCSDQFGVSEALRTVGIDLKYMGEPLTQYLKKGEKVLSL